MTWTQLAITYGALLFGFTLGWFVCALFTVGRDADEEDRWNDHQPFI